MTEPWGISGPEFIELYVAAAAAGSTVFGLVVMFLIPLIFRPRAPIGVEGVAYLLGGSGRVIDVAIARMVEYGVLRVQRSSVLHATGAPARTELDREIVRLVAAKPQTASDLQEQLRNHPLFEAILNRLAARGLLFVDSRRRRWPFWLPMTVVFLIGVVRLVNGIMLDRPVGDLSLVLVLTVIVLIWLLRGKPTVQRTKAGAKLSESVRAHGVAKRVVPLTGAAGLVAVGGFAAFPDPVIATALGPSTSVGPGNASYSDSSWDSGNSSGGGSGCGGGSGSGSGGGSSCGG